MCIGSGSAHTHLSTFLPFLFALGKGFQYYEACDII